ncbi:LPD7 domain-containing protein [Stenoxybacter acetivorans]|uniref:LPD7 domain-containing protein n=1 Tax=Stenoxybacter acetivorans TaxID=422441 RepID=UPI00068F321C|nr:LPD7 domain-containing protein [Stenoxybacter acetivorans]
MTDRNETDRQEIQNALSYLDSQNRDLWVKMGAAIKDELGEDGFDVWDEWSRQSSNYKTRDAKDVWKSLKAGKVRIGSLFYEARQNGYKPEKPYAPPTAEAQAKRKAEAQARQQQAAEATRAAQAKAQFTAQTLWKNGKAANPNHPYLKAKGITDPAVISQIKQSRYQGQSNLLIPMRQNGEIVSMQFINENGGKRFLTNGKMQGSFTVIGDESNIKNGVILAEGFATAASLNQATGKPVVIAFNAGNLKAVAEQLKDRLPENAQVLIAADNDVSQTGSQKAHQAAEVFGERAQVILPEFSEAEIARYQAQYGNDKLPSDFNDLQQLAGIEAVKQSIPEHFRQPEIPEPPLSLEPKNETMQTVFREHEMSENNQDNSETTEPKPERSAWGDFPPVVRNSDLGELYKQPEYKAAKGGDVIAAKQMIDRMLINKVVAEMKQMIGDRKPYLVPVLAEEVSGKNKIPLAMAHALGRELDLPVEENIRQIQKVNRTGSGIDHRFAHQPIFSGEVKPDREYIVVDDSLSVGGTIASLKGYIENRGGKVLGAAVVTAHEGALHLPVKPTMLANIERNHGNAMNQYWKSEFGYGIDKLTQAEAGHLKKPTVEQIRERINIARQLAQQAIAEQETSKENHHEPNSSTTNPNPKSERTANADTSRDRRTGQGYENSIGMVETTISKSTEKIQLRNGRETELSESAPKPEAANPPLAASSISEETKPETAIALNKTIELEPIKRLTSLDEEQQAVQDAVIAQVEADPERFLQSYANHPDSFNGRYVCSDLMKDQFAEYNASNEARSRYVDAVHNTSAVLASAQFKRALESAAPNQDKAIFLTGVQGAGKTSSVLYAGKMPDDYAVIYEGQLANPNAGISKIQAALDQGLKPHIIAVHALPENALNNTFKRFNEVGRGAPIEIMARLQGNLPNGLEQIHQQFGDKVSLMIVDKRDIHNPQEYHGWNHINLLRSEGNHEQLKQRLETELERNRERIGEACYQHARESDFYGGTVVKGTNRSTQANERGRGIPPENRQTDTLNQPVKPEAANHLAASSVSATPKQEQAMAEQPKPAEQQQPTENSIEYTARQQQAAKPETTKPTTFWSLLKNAAWSPRTRETTEPTTRTDTSLADTFAQKKAITDINYDPPEHLKQRYLIANGHFQDNRLYYDSQNAATVLFEDQGKKLRTAKTDAQTVKDMLAVAQAKGWDSIKLSGSKEFKSLMYAMAASQGIQTTGYTPTAADLALAEKLRQERSLNSIEAGEQQHRETAAPAAPAARTDPNQATAERIIDLKKQTEPDLAALAEADKLEARNQVPIGGSQTETPAPIARAADDLRHAALQTELVTVKAACSEKVAELSPINQAKFGYYERHMLKILDGLAEHPRTEAMRNFYENAAKDMDGKEFNWVHPMQTPEQQRAEQQQAREQQATQRQWQTNHQETQQTEGYDIDR